MSNLSLLGFASTRTLLFVLLFIFAIIPSHASTPIKAADDSFWDTGMRLCDVDANGNCHNGDYALSISRFAIGGGVAALLTLLALIFFLPVRFCCNGFGGKKPTYGICPGSSANKRDYTRGQILAVKIATCLLIIPIVIAVGIGFRANSEISSSVNNITVSLVTSGDQIYQDLNDTRDVVLKFTNDASAVSILNNAVNTARDVSKNLHDAHDQADKYDKLRESLMIIGFVLSLVAIVAGIIAALFNLRVIAMVLGILGMFGLIFVWLCFGIHFVADKFVYDVCVDIDLLANNNTVANTTSIFKTGALAELWACDNNTELVQLQALVEDSINEAASQACSSRADACNNGNGQVVCLSTPACSRDTLLTVMNEPYTEINDNGQLRSLNECAIACSNSQLKQASASIVSSLDAYVAYTDLYYNTLLPILNCQLATEVLLEVRGPLCENMFDNVYGVAISSLIVGIFFVPFVILMVVGFKRFRSLDSAV